MKAWIAVLATAAALSVVTQSPATADHKPTCGKMMVETGIFIGVYKPGKKVLAENSASSMCRAELIERGKSLYGSNFSKIEKYNVGCVEGQPYSKYWCLCSGEPCMKVSNPQPSGPIYGPGGPPIGPAKGLRVPSPPSGGFSGPGSRSR